MGLMGKSSYGGNTEPGNGNPVPTRFAIQLTKRIGEFDILLVKYPDCKNFEGDKILVFRGLNGTDRAQMKGQIDPHFTKGKLVARFVPTHDGWGMAEAFVRQANSRPGGLGSTFFIDCKDNRYAVDSTGKRIGVICVQETGGAK